MGKNWGNLILFFSFIYLLTIIILNKQLYSKKFNFSQFEKKYYSSQWAIPHSKNVISDEDLYAYAGFKYIKGLNPIHLAPEVPPLGKYLIGASIYLFNNQRVASLIFALLSLAVIYHLIYFSTKSNFASSLGVLLTTLNTLFTDQIIHSPQLDIFQLLFLLLFIILFMVYRKTNSRIYFFSSGLAFGYFISTKFFLLSFLIINLTLVLYFLISKTRMIKSFIELTFLNVISLAVYMFTYVGFFMYGGSFRGFLGVQKWILQFYSSSTIDITKLLGNYLSLIFFNRYRFWSEGYPIIHYQYWSFFWPIIFILALFSAYYLVISKEYKKNDLVIFMFSFLIIYNLLLFVTPIYPRYLLLLFVPLNILIAIYISKIIHRKISIFKF